MPITQPPDATSPSSEDFIREEVLPRYTQHPHRASGTGLQTTRLREDARAIIKNTVHGDDDTRW